MLAPILMAYASKEQQDRFLPDIRDNKVMWCQGYSEPGAGSDLASLKTKAELTEDGKHYIVNGTKIWTTMGHAANWIFCLTRTQTTNIKQEGVTFLLFDMKSPGVEVKPIYTLGGSHHVNQVFFTDVKVPVENRVGEEGKGWTYAKGLLQHERKGLAGISRSVYAMEKLKEKACKVPVGDKTLIDTDFKKKIATAEIDLLALEYTELRTLAEMVNTGSPGHSSSVLKLKGTLMQQTIQELTLEAAGIYGAPFGHKKVGVKFGRAAMEGYLNGRPATIYGGCSEVQRDVIAKRVLGV
jgi:alkylation response protein AidB-like acyl-CoA dehydrogenase